MAKRKNGSAPHGSTLVELLVAVAVAGVIVALTTQVLIGVDRDQATRKAVVELQGEGRTGLAWLEQDLRQASIGSGSGNIWTAGGAAAVRRPAVQVFAGIPGGGFLPAKPGTSAVLVVQALSTPRTAVVGDQPTSTVAIPVTSVAGLAAGQPVLLGDYGDASWGVLAAVNVGSNQLTLTESAVNVFPGQQVRRLPAGSFARPARARLYYVDTADRLVRLTLAVPRAPAVAAEALQSDVLGEGFENLQLTCQLDDGGGGFAACPAPLGAGDPISAESAAAFGAFGAGQGPLFSAGDPGSASGAGNIGLLRSVTANAVVRSRRPLASTTGDPAIPLGGAALPVGGGSNTDQYFRRGYSVTAAVRNTSLGAF